MNEYTIILDIEPVPCPRPRVSKFGTYYPKSYKDFQSKSIELLKPYKEKIIMPKDGALSIHSIFVFERPKYMRTLRYSPDRIIHTRRPDLDNLMKSINDSLQSSKIIHDDSSIYESSAMKYYSALDERGSIKIIIKTK